MDPNAMVRALEKLLEYAASGIGAVAGPMLAPWQARREAAALQIAAQGEADALRIIAAAQVEARNALVSTASGVRGAIDIAKTVRQRIQFQEDKRHKNIESVVGRTAGLIGEKGVPNQEPDHDWTARFFNYIQDVSSDEMQLLWAKVLAGQIEHPGNVSIRGLSILRNLDQATAKLFQKLCSCCVMSLSWVDVRVPSLGRNAGTNSLKPFGFSFGELNILNEHGLIISDYNSWYDMRLCVGVPSPAIDQQNTHHSSIIRAPFRFQDRNWVLVPSDQRKFGSEFRVEGVALTQSGKELSKIVECEPVPEYHKALVEFFASKNLVMTEVEGSEPHVLSNRVPTP